ncbi:MAG: superoxide dismutase, Ni [Deltaproteobacteria bacterium]|jgi:nickel superoxide dismutase|nr:superoxide dismutase, Ni [Deltaproteobacteria bacterium]
MKKKCLQTALVFLMIFFTAAYAAAHCEIPCGIYDDEMRVMMIAEHITTIEKSMKQIVKLRGQKPENCNQRVRWVMNKEDHANELQHIVSQYFMTQRIKLDAENYAQKLSVLHKMLVYAMKCKQTTDLSHISKLRSLLEEFHDLYFDHGDK